LRSVACAAENAPLGKNCIPRGRIIALAAATAGRVRENAHAYDESASGGWCLNTPRLVADDTQKTVWKWEQQEPFGVNVANEDPDADSVTFEFNLRYPGQYFDKETNAHYNYFRDYDPSLGRYVQSDPIGLRGGINTFSYAGGNAISRVDPFGLIDRDLCISVCVAGVIKACDNLRQMGIAACGGCLLLRSPPLVATCFATCTKLTNFVSCVGAGTAACIIGCNVIEMCTRKPAE